MDLKLLLKGYHEEVSNVEMAEMKKKVIEDRLLLEANKKLEMNQLLAGFSLTDFTTHMNNNCKKNKIIGIKIESRLGKNYKEIEKRIVFKSQYDDNELVVVFQIFVNEVEKIDVEKIGTFGLSVYLDEISTVELNRFNGLVELARYLDELAVDGKLNEVIG
ncbi:MAG: hypothetical protein ACRCZ0_07285 [Cetobacterium sp.]